MRIILTAFIVYQILIRLLRKLVHFPAPAFIGRFLDSNLRRAMQPAAPLIRRLLRPGGILAVSKWLFDPDYPLKRATILDLCEAGFRAIRADGNICRYTASAANP